MSGFTDNLALLLQRGGWVMIPLLVLSIISIALIIERTMFWLSASRAGRSSRMAALHHALRTGQRKTVERLISGDRSTYAAVIRTLLKEGTSDAVAVEASERQRPRLERFMVSLSTIITAAPLLGILGTVIGIIRSFNLLGSQETLTDPRAVSVGIAEALLTTALGLMIALLTLFPYMIFKGQADRAIGLMESLIASTQQGFGPASSSEKDRTAEHASHTPQQRPAGPKVVASQQSDL